MTMVTSAAASKKDLYLNLNKSTLIQQIKWEIQIKIKSTHQNRKQVKAKFKKASQQRKPRTRHSSPTILSLTTTMSLATHLKTSAHGVTVRRFSKIRAT